MVPQQIWGMMHHIEEALRNCGFDIMLMDEKRQFIEAKTPPSIGNWGERISVQLTASGSLKARSESVLPTQRQDWGKNRRNIRRFYSILDQLIAA